MSRRAVRAVRGPDGLTWTVEVRAPGTTNAMVVFHHPDPLKRATRYAWWVTGGPEARDVTGRLDPVTVLAALDDAALLRLFRRSMPVESQVPRYETG